MAGRATTNFFWKGRNEGAGAMVTLRHQYSVPRDKRRNQTAQMTPLASLN